MRTANLGLSPTTFDEKWIASMLAHSGVAISLNVIGVENPHAPRCRLIRECEKGGTFTLRNSWY